MNLEALRTVRVAQQAFVRLIVGVVNWSSHSQSGGSKARQQSGELVGSATPTNFQFVENEGLLEQDGDRELFEDPFVMR